MAGKGVNMIVCSDGKVRWQDENHRWTYAPVVQTGSAKSDNYVKRQMAKAGTLFGLEALRAISNMAQDFLDSYPMPEDTANLKESTSVIVVRSQGISSSDKSARYISNINVTHPQKWGNWGGIEAGSGRGEAYRWDADDLIMSGETLDEDMTVMLRVGIPYGVPLDQEGSHGKHKGFFRAMSAAFRKEVYQISADVARNMSRKRLTRDEEGFYDDPELSIRN